MEGLIHHFKLVTEGFRVPAGQVYAAVENLLDTEYDVGRTPVRTIGWPRTFRAGVRIFAP